MSILDPKYQCDPEASLADATLQLFAQIDACALDLEYVNQALSMPSALQEYLDLEDDLRGTVANIPSIYE